METAEIEVLVDELGERVERLRALYEQYFMGIEKIEPAISRKDADRRLWVLRREQIRNTGVRYKLNMVIQRYNTYQQYWQRILREIEAGTYKRDVRKVANRFGTDALTAQARKRFGKMLERTGVEPGGQKRKPATQHAAADEEEFDVEVDDFAVEHEVEPRPSNSGFGRLDDDESAVVTSAPTFGKLDLGDSSRPPTREHKLFDVDDEDTAPRRPMPAMDVTNRPSSPGTDPAPPPSEPPSFPSAQLRSPFALGSNARLPVPAPPPMAARLPPAVSPPKPAPIPAPLPPPQRVAAPLPPAAPPPVRVQAPAPPPVRVQAPAPPPVRVQAPAPPPEPEVKPALLSALAGPVRRAPAPPAAAPARAVPAAVVPPRPAPPRVPSAAASAVASKPAAAPPSEQRAAAELGIAPVRVRQIYESYVQARRDCKESTSSITESGLADMLRASAEKLKDKHSGKNIDFDVVIKNGKAILKPVIKG